MRLPVTARAQTPSRPLSPARRRLFGALTVLLPFVLIGLLELILRVSHYGPNLRLFRSETIRGVEYLTLNPGVKGRYFSTVEFSPSMSPDFFRAKKLPGTYRIFFLGGSTTVGYPYWYNGSFSSFLRQHLRAAFPDRTFEIVNIGMTATNSFTVLDMATEVMNYQPDLLIVYDGHNEFYGALGVASMESLGGSRFLTLLSLRLLHFKTYLLLRSVLTHVRGWIVSEPTHRSQGTLMEGLARGHYVPYGSPLYWRAYDSFRANIQDLLTMCRAKDVPVILSTQVSDLRDQPPFISRHAAGLPPADAAFADSLLARATTALHAGNAEDAVTDARRARSIDSSCAQASYILGQALEAQRHFRAADTAYVAARDFDELRFRMSSDFNRLVLSFNAPPAVFVADMERTFRDASPDSLIGHTLITEHLHPNSRGYFLAAKEYARLMRLNGLGAPTAEWTHRDTLTDEDLWNLRSVTELDEMVAKRRTEVLTSGWPFVDQFPIVNSLPTDTLSVLTEQLTRGMVDWESAHMTAAQYYERRGKLAYAEREYRAIIDQIPLDIRGYMALARLLLVRRDLQGMARVLQASLAIEPTIQAYRTLGDIAMNDKNPKRALVNYEQMARFPQTREERAQNDLVLARAYLADGQAARAKEVTLQILSQFPSFQPAVQLLVEISKQSP